MRCLFATLVVVLGCGTLHAAKPNVLFIAVDDMRCDLGCYGVDHVHSPNIDAFAKTGVTFHRAYVQQAVCNASRASLMTGLRPDSTKVWDLATDFRTTIPDAVTIPQHFRKHGYRAVAFGKIFHNPFPDNVSWDEPTHRPRGVVLWSAESRKRLAAFKQQMRKDGKTVRQVQRMRGPATEVQTLPDDRNYDGKQTTDALVKMRTLAKGESPFFLAIGYIRPHLPFVVPKKYWDLYDRSKIPLAENPFLPRQAPRVAFGTGSRGGFYELADYMDYADAPSPFVRPLSEAQQRELKHGYYASVSFIDAQIGRLLAELDRLGLTDNTVVVLWSDHGWKLGEHNGWCKQTNYEIDTRTPLMIRVPSAKANGKPCHALVEHLDIYPTLCEVSGLPIPKVLEGKSLAPLLADSTSKIKDAAFSQFPRRQNGRQYMGYTVRTERYRYIEWVDKTTGKTFARELYDHKTDPLENENVADGPGRAKVIETLAKRLWQGFDKTRFTKTRFGEGRKRPTEPKPKPKPKPKQRPNFLFLMADDWSWPHAGVCGDANVKTPTFDRIAREGVLFENAHVSAPSCTPSRMAIATGQWHWRLKEAANLGGSLAKDVPVYPELLQAVGYKIGYARKGAGPSKHRYTKRDPFGRKFESFEQFLKSRKKGEPFCFWYGAGEPHRPYLYGEGANTGLVPSKLQLPACLPDDEITRNDFADYLHRVQRFDTFCHEILEHLEQTGELNRTIVVMSGDNGMPFPRCKATLYDTGTHVPLAIRWGSNIRGGRIVRDFVSLTDLAPTFLEVAGEKIPPEMTGQSLLGLLKSADPAKNRTRRTFVLTGMERHVYKTPCRAIRTADYLYIRNVEPAQWKNGDNGKPQPKIDFTTRTWPTHEGAFSYNIDPSPTKQYLLEHRNATDVKRYFTLACGQRPEDELYDLKADPQEQNNVANNPRYRSIRKQLREKLEAELRASGDPRFSQSTKPE